MDIYLYNTLTRKKEKFVPVKAGKKVRIYNCGPTVYDDVHLGNLFSYTFRDTLTRTLEYLGYDVETVMNITDVGHLVSDEDTGEDKLEKKAKKEGKSAGDIALFFTSRIFGDLGNEKYIKAGIYDPKGDMGRMNYRRATHLPKATEYIEEMIVIIQKLEKKGFVYVTELGVYFDITKFKDYGKLSGQSLEDKLEQVREELVSDPKKKHPADFALWLFTKGEHAKHEMKWESPWGEGFPGWHIECSAMSEKHLGVPFDIHTGGIDNMPVHHENEIAQTECSTGKKMANFWMHNQMITVDGGKMSKSKDNFFLLSDVMEKGFTPMELRYHFLGSHYRTRADFSWEALAAARNAMSSLRGWVRTWVWRAGKDGGAGNKMSEKKERTEQFKKALADDLNTPAALAVLWKVVKDDDLSDTEKLDLILGFDSVLGLRLEEIAETADFEAGKNISELVQKREALRKKKKFDDADVVRKEIEKFDVELEDTSKGSVWRWVS